MCKKLIILIAFLIGITVGLSACGPEGNSNARKDTKIEAPKATPIEGTWKSTDPNITAIVKGGTIEVNFTTDPDTSALYWKGTFPTEAVDNANIVSQADTEALSASLMGSQDKVKPFTYENETLSFNLQMMGVKRTIHLTR